MKWQSSSFFVLECRIISRRYRQCLRYGSGSLFGNTQFHDSLSSVTGPCMHSTISVVLARLRVRLRNREEKADWPSREQSSLLRAPENQIGQKSLQRKEAIGTNPQNKVTNIVTFVTQVDGNGFQNGPYQTVEVDSVKTR